MATNTFVHWSDGLGGLAFHYHSGNGGRAFANENCPPGRASDHFFQMPRVFPGGICSWLELTCTLGLQDFYSILEFPQGDNKWPQGSMVRKLYLCVLYTISRVFLRYRKSHIYSNTKSINLTLKTPATNLQLGLPVMKLFTILLHRQHKKYYSKLLVFSLDNIEHALGMLQSCCQNENHY